TAHAPRRDAARRVLEALWHQARGGRGVHGRSVSAHEHVGEGKARRDGGLATRNTSRQTKAGYTNGCNHTAPVAQRIEHPPPKRGAAGSIPAGRASFIVPCATDVQRRIQWAPGPRRRSVACRYSSAYPRI